jgi:PAS domain S-box-containing protein
MVGRMREDTRADIAPALVGQEVACRVFEPLFDAAAAKGVPASALTEGTGVDAAVLRDPRARVPWETFRRLMANAGRIWSPAELEEIGANVPRSPMLRSVAVIAKLLFAGPELYAWVFGPGGPASRLIAAEEGWVYRVGRDRLRFELWMRPGYAPSPENFHVLRGTLRGMSRLVGYGDSVVEMTSLTNGVRYDIELPRTGGGLAWLRRILTWPFTVRAAGEELRKAHEMLHERYLELQNEVGARVAAEAARAEAERELDRARQLEILGRLAGGVAHDFNNLLSVVLAYADGLLAKSPDPRTREALLAIRGAGLRGAALTRQMLALGRRDVAAPGVHDLRDVVTGTGRMLARVLPEKVRLDVQRGDDPVPVDADRGQLEQVVLNLALNARDAMEDGGVLTLRVERQGSCARVLVGDEGVGMDAATRDRAFEPFFTTKPAGSGSGLGLPQVRAIVEGARGSVHVDSAPGRGTRVEVLLPLSPEQAAPADAADPEPPASDDAELVAVLRAALAARGLGEGSEEEHERWLVTLRSIGDGVVVTDAVGGVLLINPVAEQITGWTQAEAAGRPTAEVCPLFDEMKRKEVDDPVAEVLRTRQSRALHDHTLLRSRDGTPYPIAFSVAPVLIAERLIGAVLVFRDMRARRRLEEELVRSAKLEAVGDLAGSLAHDFNNVLAAIQGSVSIALRKVPPTDLIVPLLRVIADASHRGGALTRELLAYARGGAPVIETVDLQDPIRRAASVALTGSRCRARFSVAPDLLAVQADPGQIQQALQNLVRNACQAMPEGGVVEIHARNDDVSEGITLAAPAGKYVRIDVIDHGQGIPDDQLSHIFDPFYTTKANAVGLGLATVHSIVHSHGGHVAAESRAGQGTTFTIRLPAAEVSAAEASAPADLAPLGARRVLVMDDEALVRDTWKAMLEELGYTVELAADGDEAVAAWSQGLRDGHPFDLVVLDLVVPGGKGGVDALRELMLLDPRVRAIACSGYSPDPVMANHREFGFAAALPKPFDLDAVKRKLAHVLGEEHAPGA